MEAIAQVITLDTLLVELKTLKEQEKALVKEQKECEKKISDLRIRIDEREKETKTMYVNSEGIVFEIQQLSQHDTKFMSLNKYDSGKDEDYFFSKGDSKVHQATGWHSYYYYDENNKAHHEGKVHAIIATSDKGRYPGYKELTAEDLVK